MVTVDRETVCQVFELFDGGKTPYFIDREGIATQRTAERLKAAHGRIGEGRTVGEIASATGWCERRVRTIQRWWEECQQANNQVLQPAQGQMLSDPVVSQARLRHFALLTNLAQGLSDAVEEEEGEENDEGGYLDSTESIRFKLVVWPDRTVEVSLQMEEDRLFPGLKSHLLGYSELWGAYDQFKDDLLSRCRKRYDLSNPGVRFIDMTPVPGSGDTFYDLLDVVLTRGITTGRCKLCPDFQPTNPGK